MLVATSFPEDIADVVRTFERLDFRIVSRERLVCKGRDEIVLLSPRRHAGFRAGKKPVSSKVHNAVTSRLVST